ncbi:antirestriction protein ArdA [Brachybacterium sp. FME24]|uniref:antirestriction protein ArdA n=1 Tax=Brachybacterium sp. FME24 TaxID=2742605 RepID=UPI0018673093|nr:antirestriction protein ArdA [Brachybacterium sp. FME24]
MTTTTEPAMKVWIGCLACYNNGQLVGEWFHAIDADEVTLADVHRGSGGSRAGCEELWCLDVDDMPVHREMSPTEAAEWGRIVEDVDEHLRPALLAWVRSGNYVAVGTGDLPSVSDFEERYAGAWDDFNEYAHQLAEDIGLLADVPEEVARYFDWKSWTRDLAFDFTVEDAPGSGVFVFRNL